MYDEAKRATENRNNDLMRTLDVSEDFWSGLDEVRYELILILHLAQTIVQKIDAVENYF